MCPSASSSLLALTSLTGFANFNPSLLKLHDPAPDISALSAHLAPAPSTLARDFSANEGSQVRPEEGRTVNLLERFEVWSQTSSSIRNRA
ncbi:uncharacterized protein N7529_008872 [Penicillium soppii]|uniref:uncharacterized protein n=1 Tax=Penicillium soppii TaxID=69789 RepID=UPI00254892BB|nr:uncharacterized protein N7529_008872 [Penicillium soppii]KAJ5861562.1 hypothetical protein N7529_008872 [Penicillium soppii]